MHHLPRITPVTAVCTTPSLAMTKPTLESFALGLCGTLHGPDVPYHCGCTSLDAHIMSSITSTKTIQVFRSVFGTHGLPQKVVTDNGPSFTSQEFQEFMQENGIKHVTSSPYHPSTNGLAERGVQTLKLGIKRTKGGSLQEKLSRFLFDYRITPHSPAM